MSRALRAVAIVPARLASQRLPRKMLLDRTGDCLFVHTARNVAASGIFARVVVAADDPETLAAAHKAGVDCRMTRVDHASGTDRVWEAWEALEHEHERADVIVNVQGDEPEIAAGDLIGLVRAFDDRAVELATLCCPLGSSEEAERASVVKVVRDASGDALYFSRAAIPARGHARSSAPSAAGRGANTEHWTILRRHIGVYAFTPVALSEFCALPTGRLEACESLEQLRWLEAGRKIRVLEAERFPEGIDTLEDYERFVARCAARATTTRT